MKGSRDYARKNYSGENNHFRGERPAAVSLMLHAGFLNYGTMPVPPRGFGAWIFDNSVIRTKLVWTFAGSRVPT